MDEYSSRGLAHFGVTLVPQVYLGTIGEHRDDRISLLDLSVGPQQLLDDPLGRQRCMNRSQIGRGRDFARTRYLVTRNAGERLEQQRPVAGVALLSCVSC